MSPLPSPPRAAIDRATGRAVVDGVAYGVTPCVRVSTGHVVLMVTDAAPVGWIESRGPDAARVLHLPPRAHDVARRTAVLRAIARAWFAGDAAAAPGGT